MEKGCKIPNNICNNQLTNYVLCVRLYQILMEYMFSGNLTQKMRNKKLRLEEALDIAISIGQAVAYLHGNRPPIIHRDLKPDNIMFGSGGQAKLGDFGLARIRASKKMDRGYKMTGRTGTLRYMAPEVLIEPVEYDEKVDVYSLGLITYFVVTSYQPFMNYSRCEREDFARKRQNFKVPSSIKIHEELKEFIEEAVLAHNYSRPKAIDFVYNLQQYALNQGIRISRARAAPRTKHKFCCIS
mmetsp:Transcript_16105/g.25754  ORF Transcript_16105/g.25754 Transcript_16105/m.25754 type:complete len:241 (+) Transcript_16105:679-1401(+)